MSRRRRGQGRCRDYGDDYNDDYDVVVTRIDDDQDVPSLTTHNDESNRVISASLKAHSLGVTRILTCVWHNKTAQSTVKRKFICARWHTYFFFLEFPFKKRIFRYYDSFLKARRCTTDWNWFPLSPCHFLTLHKRKFRKQRVHATVIDTYYATVSDELTVLMDFPWAPQRKKVNAPCRDPFSSGL